MRTSILSLLVLLALPPAVQAGATSRMGREAVHEVRSRIEARDCGAAVARLKAGLRAGHPEVWLLAGSMYEHGICVKADWDNAVTFYTQAYERGFPEAAERLAAGYADPARGPDIAAALWWSLRDRGGARHEPCAVSPAAQQDPDGFVAELKTWDPGKLALCNYIVGVLSTISAEVKYPTRAQASGMQGEVVLRFRPAVPRIDLKTEAGGAFRLFGWLDGDSPPDQDAGRATGSFETALREVANRALRRYPQPSSIPPSAEASVKYVFQLEDELK